jgi:hypothetical protein|tara:strand:+ start:258 stop:779 length:522 start_codon:yes stop_codon:yes gene_type:complete
MKKIFVIILILTSFSFARNDSQNISEIIDAYLELKNALTEDSENKAVEAGYLILDTFDNFNISELTKDQHREYIKIAKNAKEQVGYIVKIPITTNSADGYIDQQREHFQILSNDIDTLITLLGIQTDKTLYKLFCPMYNDDKGAMWLSETDEIKNPFYGSKMLKCGKVQEKIN